MTNNTEDIFIALQKQKEKDFFHTVFDLDNELKNKNKEISSFSDKYLSLEQKYTTLTEQFHNKEAELSNKILEVHDSTLRLKYVEDEKRAINEQIIQQQQKFFDEQMQVRVEFAEQIKKQQKVFFDQYTILQKELITYINILNQKDNTISSLRASLEDRDRHHEAKDLELAKLHTLISDLSTSLSYKDIEIESMKLSKFWKLRVQYMRIKWAMTHPLKFAKKHISKSIPDYSQISWAISNPKAFAKKHILKKPQYLQILTNQNISQKEVFDIAPIRSVFYISNVAEGGSKKYLTDLIETFGTCHLQFFQIKNKNDLEMYKNSFKKGDILLFQYLFLSDFTFKDVIDLKIDYDLKLVIPIHEFYFLGKSQNYFYTFNVEVHSNYIGKPSFRSDVFQLLKSADVIIYPSNFVKNIFDSIFVFKQAVMCRHIDYATYDFLDIPAIEKVINIAIINNVTVYKGAEQYPQLFRIKKYKGYTIQYHVFGMDKIEGPNVIFHGPYIETEIFSLLRVHNIHGLVFLNKFGETHSYSLTKGINSGLPILYSYIGAYIERLEGNNKFFPIRDRFNVEVPFQKMLHMIIKNSGTSSGARPVSFEKDIPDFYKDLFFIDYDELLNKKFLENKEIYEKVFEMIEPYAIYFPQFHALPENTKTFYEGYHDMINLEKAKTSDQSLETPLKNYLGFYDLKAHPEIIAKQVALAQAYGFKGFGIYYYWFSHNSITGKNMLMDTVIDIFFEKELSGGFDVFFIYANESWSDNPAFNQETNEHIIRNEYSRNAITKNFENLVRYFKHANYKKVNNKPVLFLHHPWEMTRQEFELFYLIGNETVKKYGFDGLELVVNAMHGQYSGYRHYSHHPDYKTTSSFTNIENGTRYIDYKKYVDEYLPYTQDRLNQIQTAFYNFDNTVRFFNHKNKDVLVTKTKHNSLDYFKKFLEVQLDTYRISDKNKKIFLINAWNEWGEQMSMEPSSESGFKLLDAFNDVLLKYAKTPNEISGKGIKKIICVGHDAGYYGAQLLLLFTMKELKERFRFDIHFILKAGGPLEEEYKKYTTVYNLTESYRTLEQQIQLIENLKESGATHAIVNTVLCADILDLLHSAGIKTVSLVHELPGAIKKYSREENLKIIAEKADHIVFPSRFVKDTLEKIVSFADKNSSIRPQGLTRNNLYKNKKSDARKILRKNLGLSVDSFVVLAVGSGDYRKGIDLFLDVAMKTKDPNIHFVWIGDIDSEIKTIVDQKLKECTNVTMYGITKEISLFYAGADIYLMTSREEPFGTLVIESMFVGVPVIGFADVGGFADIVTEKTGILVPAGDTNTMALAVHDLLKDDARRKRLCDASQKLIEKDFIFKDYVYDILAIVGMPYKKVSVIVPNYNYARYLNARFDSIMAQTYPIYEMIVLDDASTDNSIAVIDEYIIKTSFNDIKKNIRQKNSGSVFFQWTTGIHASSGDYIWIAEADDLSDPIFLESVIEGFDDERVVLSYSQSEAIDEDGKKIGTTYIEHTNDIDSEKWKKDYIRSGFDEICDSLAIKNTIPNVSAVVFKKIPLDVDVIKKIGDFSVAGDWFFYVWLLQQGYIAYTAKVLNIYRRHQAGVTHNLKKQKHLDEIVAMQNHIIKNFPVTKEVHTKVNVYRKKISEFLLGKEL